MRLVHARRMDNGRVEIRRPAAGTTAARILAQQIVYHLTHRDAQGYKNTTSHDSEVLYRESLAQQGFVNPLVLYHARKYASSQETLGVEQ